MLHKIQLPTSKRTHTVPIRKTKLLMLYTAMIVYLFVVTALKMSFGGGGGGVFKFFYLGFFKF